MSALLIILHRLNKAHVIQVRVCVAMSHLVSIHYWIKWRETYMFKMFTYVGDNRT